MKASDSATKRATKQAPASEAAVSYDEFRSARSTTGTFWRIRTCRS
jgi:hypothetical protein